MSDDQSAEIAEQIQSVLDAHEVVVHADGCDHRTLVAELVAIVCPPERTAP